MPYVSRRDEAMEEIAEHLGPVAEGMAEATSEEIVGLMRRSDPTGHEYPLPSGGTYEASAPGEPPAVRTGQYARSYDHTDWQMSRSGRRAVAVVTNDRTTPDGAFLWPFLEYGTALMAARPHVRPSAEKMAGVFRRAANAAGQRGRSATIRQERKTRALPPAA